MASTPINDATTATETQPSSAHSFLVHLTAPTPESIEPALANLALAFPGIEIPVAIPDTAPNLAPGQTFDRLKLLHYTPPTNSSTNWVLTAADYFNTFKLAQEHNASSCLMLGAASHSMTPESIRALAQTVATGKDLVVAHYHPGPNESLLNSAVFYPVTRALYCARPRFPLAIDLGLSLRMAERLATVAQRFTASGQDDALIWPVAEASVAGYTVAESDVPQRESPTPPSQELNALLNQLASSLFTDIDLKASFWQRVRQTIPKRTIADPQPPGEPVDVKPMLDSFNLAYSNLQEIWSLVLPPHALLGLKHLSVMPQEAFRIPNSLWARIIYDFVLAYRLRTINRNHLIGALTPLYLAWVASHLILVQSGVPPEQHVEEQALSFETDKPYLVSRWRWPDRFNP